MQISLINNKPPLKDKSVGGSNNNGVAAAESADGNRDAARRGVKVGGDKVSRSREEIHIRAIKLDVRVVKPRGKWSFRAWIVYWLWFLIEQNRSVITELPPSLYVRLRHKRGYKHTNAD